MGPRRQYVDDQPDAPVELHIYPGCDASFLLYEDEGDGYNYEESAFSTINIGWQDSARQLILGERSGSYPGMPDQRQFLLILHDETQAEPGLPESTGKTVIDYTGQPVVVDL